MLKTRKKLLGMLLIISCSMFCFGVTQGFAAEGGPCEVALYRCITDPVNIQWMEGGIYCALGYIFCLKYVK